MRIIEIFKLFGRILVDNDEANKSISKTDKEAKGLGERLGSGIKTAAKWGAGIITAAGAAGTAAFAMATKTAAGFDDISKGAQKAGIATDFYQEMDFWASQNGLSQGNMEKAVGRLNQRIGAAADGNEKYAGALEQLGVNMDDVREGTVTTEEAMTQSIQALSEMENGHEQAALAAELFGTKLGREMLPALQDGALSIEDAKKQAEELGIVIGEDALNAGVAFTDTWDQLKRSFTAVTQQVMGQLMPIFQTLMDWVLSNMPLFQSIFERAFGVIQNLFSIAVQWIQTAIGWLAEFYNNNKETFQNIWTTIKETFDRIVEFLLEIWGWITELWNSNGESLMTKWKEIFLNIYETVQTYFNYVREIIVEILGYIVPWIQEKLQQIMQFWRENGDQIMQAVQNAFTFIQNVISFVMPIIQSMISGAWQIIRSIFDTTINVIMGLVKVFSSLLTGDFEGIKAGLTRIWESLWSGIKGVVSGAWSMLSGAFSTLWSQVSGWFTGLKDDALGWGRNMIDGFIQGIKDKIGAVKDAVSGVIDGVKGFMGFSSPAEEGEGRHIVEWGANMIDGFLDGVRSQIDNAESTMNDVVSNMRPEHAPDSVVKKPEDKSTNDLSVLETLLVELIEAVREGKEFVMNDRVIARLLGDSLGDDGSERVRNADRGLAT